MTDFEQVNRAFEGGDEIFPAGEYPRDGGGGPRTPLDGFPPDPDIDPKELLARECALLPLNDFGNGKRFTAYFGEDTLFIPRVGWFVWDGRCWAQDDDQLEVRRVAQQISAKVTVEASYIDLEEWEAAQVADGELAREAVAEIMVTPAAKRTPEQRAKFKDFKDQVERADELKKKLAKARSGHHSHAKSAGNTNPINNMMREAQVDVYKPLAALNKNKIMFNTENFVLYFEEVEKHPVTGKRAFLLRRQDHARELLLTKMMQVEYDPKAKCPEFNKFLKTILPSSELRAFVQRWFGYSITGLTTEQKLAFLYGSGRNGKSTLLELIAKIMGAYAASVPIESLSGTEQRKGGDATPDLVRLPGARMVRASEPERGTKMREALIKQLTGGADILVRRMMQEFIEVTPEFSLTIDGNYKPEIRGTDNGIWRRVLLVPFVVSIPDEAVDPLLPQKLWGERAGIFNWLLDGCKAWLEGGLMVPQEVLDATQEYREESDPVLEFIQSCCEVTGLAGDFTRAKEMNEAFVWWQVNTGASDPWGTRTIFKHLKDKTDFFKDAEGRAFWHDKSNNTGWRGIKLSDDFKQRRQDADADDRYSDA
jgi:putative DNA primase/helicase